LSRCDLLGVEVAQNQVPYSTPFGVGACTLAFGFEVLSSLRLSS